MTFFLYYLLLLVSLVLSCFTDQLPLFSRAVSTSVSPLLLQSRLETLNMVIMVLKRSQQVSEFARGRCVRKMPIADWHEIKQVQR